LFFYVKKAHMPIVPGLAEYVVEFTSERAAGEEGYLVDRGLIPLTKAERMRQSEVAKSLGAATHP
jgi:phosphate transport system substrate-binding protein